MTPARPHRDGPGARTSTRTAPSRPASQRRLGVATATADLPQERPAERSRHNVHGRPCLILGSGPRGSLADPSAPGPVHSRGQDLLGPSGSVGSVRREKGGREPLRRGALRLPPPWASKALSRLARLSSAPPAQREPAWPFMSDRSALRAAVVGAQRSSAAPCGRPHAPWGSSSTAAPNNHPHPAAQYALLPSSRPARRSAAGAAHFFPSRKPP